MEKETLIKLLDIWIAECEENAKIFHSKYMTHSEVSTEGMAMAYKIVRDYLKK